MEFKGSRYCWKQNIELTIFLLKKFHAYQLLIVEFGTK
jgi:hypothetical protein